MIQEDIIYPRKRVNWKKVLKITLITIGAIILIPVIIFILAKIYTKLFPFRKEILEGKQFIDQLKSRNSSQSN